MKNKVVVGSVWKCLSVVVGDDWNIGRFCVITYVDDDPDKNGDGTIEYKYASGNTYSGKYRRFVPDMTHKFVGMLPSRKDASMVEAIKKAQERVAGALGVPADKLREGIQAISRGDVSFPRFFPTEHEAIRLLHSDVPDKTPDWLLVTEFLRRSSRMELTTERITDALQLCSKEDIVKGLAEFLVERNNNIGEFRSKVVKRDARLNVVERQFRNQVIQGEEDEQKRR